MLGETDGQYIIDRLQREEEQDKQLDYAAKQIAALYQFEHAPLVVPLSQREKVRNFWDTTARQVGSEIGTGVSQLGKALEHAYKLASDPEYTIADRIDVRREIGNGNRHTDSLAEQLIQDVTFARLALSGGFRNPEKATALSKETRKALTERGNNFHDVVRASIQNAANFFPVPVVSRRQPVLVH